MISKRKIVKKPVHSNKTRNVFFNIAILLWLAVNTSLSGRKTLHASQLFSGTEAFSNFSKFFNTASITVQN